ncbi:hypothetical protein N7495_004046 [Penicillium taxi]|uniref:uncharacterized protein n=1 Tax=Penicillium taxi TaxID=168475 RepID=UPI0025459CD5|nr:uncharacterized protein N7495_004046 [Penicillium taxi]KAJ5899302.1 hypothetical protein N7495_004046 [Penicillium taxi]
MAYDAYSTPNTYMDNMNDSDLPTYSQPPYPSPYENDHLNMPQPQMPPPPLSSANASSRDPYAELPRMQIPQTPQFPQNSQSTGYINDAVNSAVNNANSTSYLSPDVLSQITATVIQQLKASGLDNLPGQTPPPLRSQSQQPPWSAAPEPVPRPLSASPPPVQRSESIPLPNRPSVKFEPPQPFPVSSTAYSSSDVRDARPIPKPSPDPLPRRTDSISSHGSQKPDARPKGPDRDTTVMEMTTLERIWGKLFEDDIPTKRLGQFLRGVAFHLIEDYPPGNTLVITPAKLQKFYEETGISWDPYPWQDMFDDRTSSISRLFREVKAEHHLVQLDDLKERPDTPGLTPKGFEKWASLMIQAHPDREHERLQKAVLNMPISNPDDRKERFPKELPRRLFPEVADLKLREEIEDYIMKHCGVDLPYITDEERSKASRPKKSSNKTSSPPTATAGTSSTARERSYERGRPPATPSPASVVDEEDEIITSAPIERERKPYTSQPGRGKKYDEPSSARSSTESFTTRSETRPQSSSIWHDKYDPLYSRAGSGHAPSRQYSKDSRSPSRASRGKSHTTDYRHSESDLLGRDHVPRYGGVSANDPYTESPTSVLPTDTNDTRRYRDHTHTSHARHGSRTGEDEGYYRGMLGGDGGGSAPEYKYYH